MATAENSCSDVKTWTPGSGAVAASTAKSAALA